MSEKPYRVYRGGRARDRGRSPGEPEPSLAPLPPPGSAPWRETSEQPELLPVDLPPLPSPAPPARPPRKRRRRREGAPRPGRRWLGRTLKWGFVLLLLVVLLAVAWGVAGYFGLNGGVKKANARLDDRARAALTAPQGSILTTPTTTLLLGVDTGPGREGRGRADSIVLIRTDPDGHRVSLLSIPRDLRVEIPGRGIDKINAAYAYGGAALMVDAVEARTGIPVNHVAVVAFEGFAELIDELGGVEIDVPKAIVSNRFDCPYQSRSECERWRGWQFRKGKQTMDGKRALVYSRIRENQLDTSENDITRGGRQQQVVDAIARKLASPKTFVELPWLGGDVVAPLTTDLTTTELLELGWVRFRAADSRMVRCRLGGEPIEENGVSYIQGVEENVAVVGQFLGRNAPQAPPKGAGPFAPGCVTAS